MTVPALSSLRMISLALIDPPEEAMREQIDETKLQELIDSIREVGIIEPLVVFPKADRFGVIAGHRRWLAARYAGVSDVPCVVRDVDELAGEIIKNHENTRREDVNPAEEARHYQRLLERHCGDDTDQLRRIVGQTRQYVEARLLLLRGDPAVLDALTFGRINLSVAVELNKYGDQTFRTMRLQTCEQTGASARAVRDWRRQDDLYLEQQKAGVDPAAAPASDLPPPSPSGPRCLMCDENHDSHRMSIFYVHDYCKFANLDPMLKAFKGRA